MYKRQVQGAGDSLVSGICMAILDGVSEPEILHYLSLIHISKEILDANVHLVIAQDESKAREKEKAV